jgi:phenylpropionate dioxygenase-like ring-hydroxylating dioxygenase large terminal subunit
VNSSGVVRVGKMARTVSDLGVFHACWYPVALSAELAPERAMGVNFLGGRVVAYRTAAGVAHVKSAYCRHLGADLSVGAVIGDKLRCPFHFWKYDESGACAEVPAGGPAPRLARLFSYPTQEALGIIWAFNGEAPTYPLPHFGVSEDRLQVDAFRNPVVMKTASPVVFLNGFDMQHFRVVHGLDIEADPKDMRREGAILHYRARVKTPEFGAIVQERTLWGVSTVTVEIERSGRRLFLLHGLCPVSETETRGFLVNATATATPEGAATVEQALSEARTYTLRLINEDAPIFDTIRFYADCLTHADRLLRFGLDYIASFPPGNPGERYIT